MSELESKAALGKRLRQLRGFAALTTKQLAEIAGVGQTTISVWENGSINAISAKNVTRMIGTFKKLGIDCTEEWLTRGVGSAPRLVPTLPPELFDNKRESDRSFQELLSQKSELIKQFLTFDNKAVVAKIDNASMSPIFEKGDIVGGIWQPANSLSTETTAIIEINNKKQVRKIKKGTADNLFHLSYLTLDGASSEPFEIKDITLEKIAPIIIMLR